MLVVAWLVLGLVILYGAMFSYLWWFQRDLIYRPDSIRPNPIDYARLGVKEVTIQTEDGLDLLAWWFPPKRSEAPVFLYLHGNAGNLGYRAEKIGTYLSEGFGVLLLAWRGYSGNQGVPSENGLYEDGRAAYSWLKSQKIKEEKIVIYGESLGTGVAVHLAYKGMGTALILETPFSSLPEAAQSHYPFFPANWIVKDKFDSLLKIGSLEQPILIGHGKKDYVIPFRLAAKLFNAATEPKKFSVYEEAGHNNLAEFGWPSAVINFLNEHISAVQDLSK